MSRIHDARSLLTRNRKRRDRNRTNSLSARLVRLEALEPRQLLSGTSVGTATIVSDNSSYYPNSDTPGNVLTSAAFNESDVLVGVTPLPGATINIANGTIGLFYSDETAMTLGVSQVTTITSSGTTTTDYPVSAIPSSPGEVTDPQLGAPYTPPTTLGSLPIEAGTDPEGRPMSPSLYVTDITGLDPNSVAAHAGDWQYGGTPAAPSAVFGTWKSATETIDETGATPKITFSVAGNPAQNKGNLGTGADTAPSGLGSQGFSAEVQWSLSSLNLLPGHSYRFYFMVHDGDQNKSGGDVGQAAFDLIPTQPTMATPCISTSACATSGGIVGSAMLSDSVTVSGGNNPTGTVSFTVTQPDGTTVAVGSPVTINGDGTYNAPTSILATELGTYTFHASYSGDSLNNSAVDNGQNESITTVKACPTIATCASATCDGQGNTQLSDSVTVSCGDSPSGTVTFTLTQPDGTTVAVGSPVTINGDGTYNTSTSFRATEAGTYTFHATYSGDSLNDGAVDDGQNESVCVAKACPTIVTNASANGSGPGNAQLSDSVTVSGGDNPTGTVTFTLTQPDGTTVPVGSPVTINGDGTYNTSTSFLATEAGTYTFHATYSGDSLNDGAVDDGQNESECVAKACPTIVTNASANGSGPGNAQLSDSVTVSGGDNPTGTVTFTLTQPDGTTVPVGTPITINGDGTYNASTTVLATQAGTYTFHASYSGDSLNNGAVDDGQNESVTVTTQLAQVEVFKVADQPSIDAGDTAGFTVTIKNVGQNTAQGVTLSDSLPAGVADDINWQIDESGFGPGTGTTPSDFTIVPGPNGGQMLQLSSAFVAAGDSLAGGTSISVHITGTTSLNDVDPNLPPCQTVLVNTATVNANNEAPNTPHTSDQAQVTLHSADVDISNEYDNQQQGVIAGQQVGFVLQIYNQGCVTAQCVTLNDPLPAGPANDIYWRLDPNQDSPEDFQLTGPIGHQVLSLAAGITTLAPNALMSVHVIGQTTTGDAGVGNLNNTATVNASNEPSFEDNAQATSGINVLSNQQGDANQLYVQAVFQQVLGRTADAAAIAYFGNALASGSMTRLAFTTSLTHSNEYYDDVIERAYEHYLGRQADAAGLQIWQQSLQAGLTDEELEAGFIGSPEYYQHSGGTDQSWVDHMYFDLLGRAPDAQGEAYWVAALAAGESRSAVALGFAASGEREAITVQNDYETYLGRTAGDSEIAGWVQDFEHGLRNEGVVAGFAASDEYFAQHS
jgi:uncharacterized repeat protein (TIGR01451 family)